MLFPSNLLYTSFLYRYQAGALRYDVDHLPESSPLKLNTASWRFILPGLYRKYPKKDMILDFATSSSPVITLTEQGVNASIAADVTIQVMPGGDDDTKLSVACVGMVSLSLFHFNFLENFMSTYSLAIESRCYIEFVFWILFTVFLICFSNFCGVHSLRQQSSADGLS